jgi:hypothetical protein
MKFVNAVRSFVRGEEGQDLLDARCSSRSSRSSRLAR